MSIGCLDAAVLCDVLLHDKARGVWAHEQGLKRYEHRRKGQNDAMDPEYVCDWLDGNHRTFPVVWARNFGLKQVEKITNAQRCFYVSSQWLRAF